MNFFIHHALQVVLARIRSRKDRPDIIYDYKNNEDEYYDGQDFIFE